MRFCLRPTLITIFSQLVLSVQAASSSINFSTTDEIEDARRRGLYTLCGCIRLDKYSLAFIICFIAVVLLIIIIVVAKKAIK